MDMRNVRLTYFITFMLTIAIVDSVPPEACFANFRSDDCGGPPTNVIYYWKPGSRCEVGIWRGCVPNLNMFYDEYECINTCIFVERARASDYHENLIAPEESVTDYSYIGSTTDNAFVGTGNVTKTGNDTDVTDVTPSGNDTVITMYDTPSDATEATANDNTESISTLETPTNPPDVPK
ncbi:hypothetical protein ACJJTC_003530 [Scirpophaga incertulas]